jgi:hypothetical protein
MSGPWAGTERSFRDWVRSPRATFREWREPRPLGGAVLLLLGGAMIAYVPAQFASELLFIGGTFTVIGLVFAVAVGFCGIAALAKPRFSTVFGTLGIVFSTLSLFGALGGLLVGMVVGTAGGILCYAWEPPEGYETATLAEASGFIWQEAGGFIWQDSRGFVWQTEENREVATDGAVETGDATDEADDDIGLDLVPGADETLDEDAAFGEDDDATTLTEADDEPFDGDEPTDAADAEADAGADEDGSDADEVEDIDEDEDEDEDDEIETGFEFDDEMNRSDRFDL